MRVNIIIVYKKRYKHGHEKDFVPPITGIHLASITPSRHQVRVYHQQVEKLEGPDWEAELYAISFFSGFATEAFRLADELRAKGKTVIAGGPHVSFNIEESLCHFDSIVTGEAESAWLKILEDAENNTLKRVYAGTAVELTGLPTPRYDLLPDKYFIKKVVQATRGCLYSCTFCSVPVINPGFRTRPVKDVITDIKYDKFKYWWQNKVVWFWDDNLTMDRKYAKELLKEMIPLKKWWLSQVSIDIAKDDELLSLMKQSGCIGVFLGIESFGAKSIDDSNKKQNKIPEYKSAVKRIQKHGIAVMAGFISGFDGDTDTSITEMCGSMMNIGIDVPFISILTPFKGTMIYEKLDNENRLIKDRNWDFYNGYNVAFTPAKMTPDELLKAHRHLWCDAFSLKNSFLRVLSGIFRLGPGAFLLSAFMNTFYCIKQLKGNHPIDMSDT